jgi:serine acetyltransferase
MTQQPTAPALSRLPLWSSLHDDALALIPLAARPALRGGRARLILQMLVASAGLRCILLYRLSHCVRGRVGPVGRLISRFLFWIGRHWYGCSIAGTARIEGGLVTPHPQGIVVGGGAVIGPRAWIFQNVTVGGAPGKTGMPKIGSDARIYAGAVIVGPVTLGDHVLVGANAVVTRNVPDRSAVRAAEVSVVPLPERFLTDNIRPLPTNDENA